MGLADDVEERDLADRGGDAPVLSRGGQRVSPAHRGAEGRDPLRVDRGQGAGERDRRAPVLELERRLEEVGLARAVAEPAVVEDERLEAGGGEALGEGAEPIAPRAREAVGHDDDRPLPGCAGGRVMPCGAGLCAGSEGEISTAHAR